MHLFVEAKYFVRLITESVNVEPWWSVNVAPWWHDESLRGDYRAAKKKKKFKFFLLYVTETGMSLRHVLVWVPEIEQIPALYGTMLQMRNRTYLPLIP